MTLIVLLTALLGTQDPALTGSTVDAYLRNAVADARAGLPWEDPASGQTQVDVALQGRTVTRTWTSDRPMTLAELNILEEVLLLGCEDEGLQQLMDLGVVQRDIYRSGAGASYIQEQSARTCEAKDASTRWRTVRATSELTVAVDAANVLTQGDLRTFELTLFRAAGADGDGTYRQEIHQINCTARTHARQSSEIRDESGEVIDMDDEPREPRAITAGTPLDAALQGLCHNRWPDPTDRDLIGVMEASPTFGQGD